MLQLQSEHSGVACNAQLLIMWRRSMLNNELIDLPEHLRRVCHRQAHAVSTEHPLQGQAHRDCSSVRPTPFQRNKALRFMLKL